MIIVHKGGFNIGPKYINIIVDVQVDKHNPDEYDYGVGVVIDTEKIADMALKESGFNRKKFGEFSEVLRDNVTVYRDDEYDYDTITDMLDKLDEESYNEWLERFTELEDCITNVEYNDKWYKCYIEIFINK